MKESVDRGVFRDIFIVLRTAGAYKSSHRIVALKNKFLAKNFVAVQIGCVLEFGQNPVMGFIVANRRG